MSEIQVLSERVRVLNEATDWWNSAMILALVLAALAAVSVVWTTVMALKRAKQAGDMQSQLIQAKDSQLAIDLRERDVKIVEAQRGAAEANARVAGAVAEAAKANLELAKIKTPRRLTPEQEHRISEKLKPFSGQAFAPYVFQDQESLGLVDSIGRILLAASWVLTDPESDMRIGKAGLTIFSGILIETAPSPPASVKAAANTLALALRSEGMESLAREVPARAKSPNTIHVVIGKKP